jgi:hypothetical protein
MNMKREWLLALWLLLLLGCSRSGPVERQIGDRVNACVSSNPCIVSIKDVTDFQWDQMHVFEYGATLDDIQKSIGTDYPDYVEFKRRLVFLKNGRVIHREDEPANIERPVNGQVSFDESYNNPHWSFTPETAVFRAEKKTFNGGVYYMLKQAK